MGIGLSVFCEKMRRFASVNQVHGNMLSRRLLRIKAVKALYAHFKSESDSLSASEKNLMHAIDKTYDLYHQMLWLVVDVARYAESRQELARNKKLPTHEDLNPNTKFVDNAVIAQLAGSDALAAYLERKSLGWVQYPELIKGLYDSMTEADYYKEYMASDERSYNQDRKFVEDFYLNTVDDNEAVEMSVEEQSILWADDVDYALVLVNRTLGMCRRGQEDLPLLPEFKNDDDKAFVKELFRKALVNYGEHLACIEKFTQNWDVERIAYMDNIIMVVAIAELVNFPSIPVKVTLDEYIDIAKFYSTRNSSLFVNGVLDKAIAVLKEEGKINKTGRGLL